MEFATHVATVAKRKAAQKLRTHSLEDDDDDGYDVSESSSKASLGRHSDTDGVTTTMPVTSICVREMVRRYNTVAAANNNNTQLIQRQTSSHSLASGRSSCLGLNKIGLQSNVRQFVTRIQQQQQPENNPTYCNDNSEQRRRHSFRLHSHCKSEGSPCRMQPTSVATTSPARTTTIPPQTTTQKCYCTRTGVSSNIISGDFCRDASCGGGACSELVKTTTLTPPSITLPNRRFHSVSSVEDANLLPIESSYQSKTTIAKTANGVRIIIDIYFDQEQQHHSAGLITSPSDVLGSRVETDIPQSRILNEFQQQTLSIDKKTT